MDRMPLGLNLGFWRYGMPLFGLLLGLLLDQGLKFWLVSLPVGTLVWCIPEVLVLKCTINQGIAFSWLATWVPVPLLGSMNALFLGIVLWLVHRTEGGLFPSFQTPFVHRHWLSVTWVLMVAGGLGNMIDRLFRGGVVDGIAFVWPRALPIFNLADTWLTLGFVSFMVFAYFDAQHQDDA